MKSRLYLLAVCLLLTLAVSAASADNSSNISGTIDSSDPTMSVIFITPPNCTGQGAVQLRYEAVQFHVDVSGQYVFTLGSTDSNAVFYLYIDSFDPSNGMSNCVAADNTYPFEIVQNLTNEHSYILVMVDDHGVLPAVNYNVLAQGPGNVVVDTGEQGGDGGAYLDDPNFVPPVVTCPNQLPLDAVVRSVPFGAPAYYAPSLDARTNFQLPPGTWYVIGTDGDFSEVWITCSANLIWIPTSAIN